MSQFLNLLLASFIFFTRLPFWRLRLVPKEYYKRVVELWPLVGWLTGGVMAGVFFVSAMFFPPIVAALLAVLSRVLLTGALHEDGLADFCDGMGGGVTRERRLEIMKDSAIGSYGVIGLIFYFGLLIAVLSSLPPQKAALLILAGDTWSKFCASQLINLLPYARKEEEAKSKVSYTPMSYTAIIVSLILTVLPCLPAYFVLHTSFYVFGVPAFLLWLLVVFMQRKLQGYTGDCCGATFLLCELSFYITALAVNQ